MGKIVKFFGILVLGITLTLVIFGHVTMVLIYSFDYLLETIFPTTPGAYSSLWIVGASIFPGGLMYLLGTFLERMGPSAEAQEKEEAIKAAKAAGTIIGAKPNKKS